MNKWITNLRIRTYLIAILIVAGIGGLAVAGAITANFNQLQHRGGQVAKNSIALSRLEHFVSAMEQMLITADLVIASGETYLAGGLSRQVTGLKQELSALRDYPLLVGASDQLTQMDFLLDSVTERTELQMQYLENSANLAESVITDYDNAAQELAALSEQVHTEALASAKSESDRLAQERLTRSRLIMFFAILYALMILFVLRWSLNRIATPLQQLTVRAEDAMELDRRFRFEAGGPAEIQRLGNTIDRFVNSLETKVDDRTKNLKEKTLALKHQVEVRKKTEAELSRAILAAEASTRAKSEFLSVMSHELRTPLNAVLGTIELLRDSELNADQRIYADTAHHSGNILMTLVNDVLDMSKIEAGHLALEPAELRVDEIIDSTIDIFNSEAVEKGLVLAGMIEPDVPLVINGDALRIRQVLMNLVSNAVKFTDHGHVHLKVAVFSGDEGQPQLKFEVSDTGIGIDPKDQDQLFVEFSQLDSSYTRRHGGTGLGLAICKRLVEMMGGQLTVESAGGCGSRFCFFLPLAEISDLQQFGQNQTEIIRNYMNNRITAVIGNHPQLAESVAQILAPWSDRKILRTEADLVETVKATGLAPIAIVCGLPDDDEWSNAGRRLRKKFGADIRLVALTPNATPAPAARADHKGVFDVRYLNGLKPMALLQAIRNGNRVSREAQEAREPKNGSGSILLVEDSEANSLIASEILSKAGFAVDIATDGERAVTAANNGDYDIVLMDLQMPVMDGYDATSAIRRLSPPVCDVPIIALTANVMAEGEAATRGIELDGFLSKPLAKNDLLETVQHWVAVKQGRRNNTVASG
jgi:signal transduction histidine kinase/CheY-like chemotaxis protein